MNNTKDQTVCYFTEYQKIRKKNINIIANSTINTLLRENTTLEEIVRSHRIGKANVKANTRPAIVKFTFGRRLFDSKQKLNNRKGISFCQSLTISDLVNLNEATY